MLYTGMCVKILLSSVERFLHTFVNCLSFEQSRFVLIIVLNYVVLMRLYRIMVFML